MLPTVDATPTPFHKKQWRKRTSRLVAVAEMWTAARQSTAGVCVRACGPGRSRPRCVLWQEPGRSRSDKQRVIRGRFIKALSAHNNSLSPEPPLISADSEGQSHCPAKIKKRCLPGGKELSAEWNSPGPAAYVRQGCRYRSAFVIYPSYHKDREFV